MKSAIALAVAAPSTDSNRCALLSRFCLPVLLCGCTVARKDQRRPGSAAKYSE